MFVQYDNFNQKRPEEYQHINDHQIGTLKILMPR